MKMLDCKSSVINKTSEQWRYEQRRGYGHGSISCAQVKASLSKGKPRDKHVKIEMTISIPVKEKSFIINL